MGPVVLAAFGPLFGIALTAVPSPVRAPSDARPVAERLEERTRSLVGQPYLRSPLGEGEGLDPDPRFRLDAFDCTTFVETAIALSRTEDAERAARVLDQIRYDGSPSFDHRRHLMESQWIPGLEKDGFATDITEQIGGRQTRKLELVMTKDRWEKRRIAKKLELHADRVPEGTFTIPYIAAEDLERKVAEVPPGTVINILRVEVPWSPLVVTHQGVVIVKPGSKIRWVRHASPVLKRVIDEPLASMMKRYQKPRKWPIAGVNLLRIEEPTAAASR